MAWNETMYERAKKMMSSNGCKLLSKEYISTDNDLLILCKCGSEFRSTYRHFQTTRLKMCEECKSKEKLKGSHKQFLDRVRRLVGGDYTVKTNYSGSKSHLIMKHEKCGHEYNVTPSAFLTGNRCPSCSGLQKSNTKEFKEKVYKMYKDEYRVIGEYTNSRTKIEVLHTKCGKTNMIRPNDVLKGNKCYHCSGKKRKTIEQIQEEVFDMVGNEYTVNGVYKSNVSPLTFTHNKCKGSFKMNANNFLSSEQRCPICAMSKGEQVIYKYLTSNSVKFTPQKFYPELRGLNDGSLSYDFYLPKYNMLIEFQGRQHDTYIELFHESGYDLKYQQEHDKRKRQYAKQHNIELLEIWHYDFDNIESILDQELSINNYKVQQTQQLQLQIS